MVTPDTMTMLVGEVRPVLLNGGTKGTPIVASGWRSSDPGVATVSEGRQPLITAVRPGKTSIVAIYQNREVKARLTVLAGSDYPVGTVKWSISPLPGCQPVKGMKAQPVNGGPDIYETERCEGGATAIRALTADGNQLWMSAPNFGEKQARSPAASTPSTYGLPPVLPECRRVQPGMKRDDVLKLFAPKIAVKQEMYLPEGLRIRGRDIDCVIVFDHRDSTVLKKKIVMQDPSE